MIKKIISVISIFFLLVSCSVSDFSKEIKQIEVKKYNDILDNYDSAIVYSSKEKEITKLINHFNRAESRKGMLDMARSADYKIILYDSVDNTEIVDLWFDDNIVTFTSDKKHVKNYRIKNK
ncbi:hypothetical protein LS684_09480 [Cytobacillus spongiae]|uniref:hypothetical protein n=1 Tax=Cytobacillus spongiae TaxID=2901381 RepID=UPI001F467881|nr:hypothetical protein [Cytobacillus spongiae]UII57630.1 hypothetical protein LS684_09480 [Cytobacillus spongiae]